MEIQLTPGQESLIRYGMETGRLSSPEAAVSQAMLRWEEDERRRIELLNTLKAAEASVARGEGLEITEDSMKQLAADINRRGRKALRLKSSTEN